MSVCDQGGEPDPSCKHYVRRCLLECPDCRQFFACRLCHDEKSDHQLNRYLVKRVKCTNCQHEQDVAEQCRNCSTSYGRYCCLICNMFDDRDKKQYHCVGCGLCRVGGRDNFYHCIKCGLCLSKDIETSHKCVEKSSKSNCPVCLEDLHSSTKGLTIPSCGHLIHQSCYCAMLKHGDYRCATCGKSMVEMSTVWKQLDHEIESTPMPEEYASTLTWVLCKDCQAVTEAKFHVLGMKCSCCNSYNTCGTDAPKTENKEGNIDKE